MMTFHRNIIISHYIFSALEFEALTTMLAQHTIQLLTYLVGLVYRLYIGWKPISIQKYPPEFHKYISVKIVKFNF